MTQTGLASIIFGATAITGMVVQSYGVSATPGINYTIQNASGQTVYQRLDDNKYELSLSMIFNGGTVPVVGATLSYDGRSYLLVAVDKKGEQRGAVSYDVKGEAFEYI